MNKKTSRILLVWILAMVILLAGIIQIFAGRGHEKKNVPIKTLEEESDTGRNAGESEEKDEELWMTKSQIKRYQNGAEDNRDLPESDADIIFTGYDNTSAFAWLSEEEWEEFQRSLKGFLQKKKLLDVTEVRLHADSIQVINEYERYVYMDIDHKNDYTDRLVIKAFCDTYKEKMRFAFEIQYGS